MNDDQNLFDNAFDYAAIGMALVGPDGKFLKVNQALCKMLDYSAEELACLSFQEITHPEDLQQDLIYTYELLSHKRNTYQMEKRYFDKHNRVIWILLSVSLVHENGAPKFLVSQIQDITSRKNAEKKLEILATIDPLTGLPNRYHMLKLIDQNIKNRQAFCVTRICITNFSTIQDNYGYHFADLLMHELAHTLNSRKKPCDVIGVLSRGEFITVIYGAKDFDVAVQATKKNCQSISTVTLNQITLTISSYVGASVFADKPVTAEEMIKQADLALHYAKKGGSRFLAYNAQLEQMLSQEVKIEHALPTAIFNKELCCHYQPIVNNELKVIGFESLARWTNSQLGTVDPSRFITIAEECGLMNQLGNYLLHETLRNIQELKKHIDINQYYFSINLSALQLSDSKLSDNIRLAIEKFNIPGSCLVFEITETAILADIAIANNIIEKIHKLGISTSLDDFGTGHSNLAVLAQIKAHMLKIDVSFVRHIHNNKNNLIIIMAILYLAKLLNIVVIAEGLETEDEFSCLKQLGITHYQGYYFHKPMPMIDIIKLVGQKATVEAGEEALA